MFKWGIGICVLLLLAACASKPARLEGEGPPKATIQAGGRTYETKLGTYCWSTSSGGKCVDAVGPEQLLKGKQPITVKPGAEIAFKIDYEPQPNEFHLSQISGSDYADVPLEGQTFRAPSQPGLYYYTYGVWWKDPKDPRVSNGDAFYSFALKVK